MADEAWVRWTCLVGNSFELWWWRDVSARDLDKQTKYLHHGDYPVAAYRHDPKTLLMTNEDWDIDEMACLGPEQTAFVLNLPPVLRMFEPLPEYKEMP